MYQRLFGNRAVHTLPEGERRPPRPVSAPDKANREQSPVGEGRSPFGHLLREFRMASNLSQEALAERAGLSAGGISALERGVRRAPHRDTVALLTSALALSATDLERLRAAAVRAPAPRRRGSRLETVVDHFPNGVWYVELAPLGGPDLGALRIAATFEVVVRYDAAELNSPTVARLVDKRFLIALENGEHVEEAVAAITQQLSKPLAQAARSHEQP
jgi:transcriptional regulator with XRE-family HTH domain